MPYSDEFVLSQYRYYQRHRQCGPSRDWNLIAGLAEKYEREAKLRGLIA